LIALVLATDCLLVISADNTTTGLHLRPSLGHASNFLRLTP
jgi:hypothetical protein